MPWMSKEKQWWLPVYHGGNLSVRAPTCTVFLAASWEGAVRRAPHVEKSWRTKRAEEKWGVRKRHAGELWRLRKLEAAKGKVKERRRKREGDGCKSSYERSPWPGQLILYVLLKSAGFLGKLWWFLVPVCSQLFTAFSQPPMCVSGTRPWVTNAGTLTHFKKKSPSPTHWLMRRGCSTHVCQITWIQKRRRC